MRKFRTTARILGVVAAAALGLAMLPASPAGGATSRLKVCDQNHPGYTAEVDTDGDDDFTPGDVELFQDKLLDPRTGRKAGRDVGRFTLVRRFGEEHSEEFDGLLLVDAMFFFPTGKISVYGSFKFSDFGQERGINLPITGGTGRYEGATGVLNVQQHGCDGKSGSVFRFHITKP
jgi:hypothetical protein